MEVVSDEKAGMFRYERGTSRVGEGKDREMGDERGGIYRQTGRK